MTHVFMRIKQLTNHLISWNWVGWDLEGRLKRGHSEFFEHHRWIGLKGWLTTQLLIHGYLYADNFYAESTDMFVGLTVIVLAPLGALVLSSLVLAPYQLGWSRGYNKGFYSAQEKSL